MRSKLLMLFCALVLAAMLVVSNLAPRAHADGGFDPTPTPTATDTTGGHDRGWGG